MNNANVFRASYSVMDAWQSGNYERAIKMYFKLEDFITPAMADGRTWHKKWEEHVKTTKTMPLEFGGKPLKDPRPEGKKQVHITDWLDLVGVIDCYDKPDIYEWKTGKQSSEVYANSKQAGTYGVLATMSGLYVEKAHIYHYDQYLKTYEMSTVWLTDKLLKDTLNWIETVGGEMHNYLLENKLYDQFGANLLKNGNAPSKFDN